jgi:hypothetical protein
MRASVWPGFSSEVTSLLRSSQSCFFQALALRPKYRLKPSTQATTRVMVYTTTRRGQHFD